MKFDHDDIMPIGKYKGRPMKDVPVSYLLWWYHDKLESDSLINMSFTFKLIRGYIKENLQSLIEKKSVEQNEWNNKIQ